MLKILNVTKLDNIHLNMLFLLLPISTSDHSIQPTVVNLYCSAKPWAGHSEEKKKLITKVHALKILMA
jgi:hypothetical protein